MKLRAMYFKIVDVKKVPFLLLGILLVGILGQAVVKADPSPQSAAGGLTNAIDTILADSRLANSQVGVLVRKASNGEVLYSRNPNDRLIPASNNKLYSSAAAMEVLGENYTFTTSVGVQGKQKDGVLNGNLYLKGTGDPTVQAADYDKLAADVVAAGIKKVSGHLVADDTFFDSRQLGNNWAWDNNPFYFQPEISALTVAADPEFNIGSVVVEVTPGSRAGEPAKVKTNPQTSYVSFQNEAKTTASGTGASLSIERKLGVNTVVVTGTIAQDYGAYTDLSTVSDTTGYAATLLREALERRGVRIDSRIERAVTPAGTKTVAQRVSKPLSELLPPYLKLSNNGIAEILVKAIGKKAQSQGTWDSGLNAELATLRSNLGVNTSNLQLVDGSGLSNLDFLSPKETTDLLLAAQDKSWFKKWYGSLPIAGESNPLVGGTLRSRMVGTKAASNVHAKTGSLGGVSAMSGYVTTADGESLVFSIMENNYIGASPKPLEDAIAIALANYSSSGNNDLSPQNQPEIQRTLNAPHTPDKELECSWTREGC